MRLAGRDALPAVLGGLQGVCGRDERGCQEHAVLEQELADREELRSVVRVLGRLVVW